MKNEPRAWRLLVPYMVTLGAVLCIWAVFSYKELSGLFLYLLYLLITWNVYPIKKWHFLLISVLVVMIIVFLLSLHLIRRRLSGLPKKRRKGTSRQMMMKSLDKVEEGSIPKKKTRERKAKGSGETIGQRVKRRRRMKQEGAHKGGLKTMSEERENFSEHFDDNNNMYTGEDDQEGNKNASSETKVYSYKTHSVGDKIIHPKFDPLEGRRKLGHNTILPERRADFESEKKIVYKKYPSMVKQDMPKFPKEKPTPLQTCASVVKVPPESTNILPVRSDRVDIMDNSINVDDTISECAEILDSSESRCNSGSRGFGTVIPLRDACKFPKDFCTQTLMHEILTADTCTMTTPYVTDTCVGTHSEPCKTIRSSGTLTTGPFMKKLRRAERVLQRAKDVIQEERRMNMTKWNGVVERYRDKLKFLSEKVSKKDAILGYTTSRMVVLKQEVKDTFLAVRSTKERLSTQMKLNEALMDVVESKKGDDAILLHASSEGDGNNEERKETD